MASLALSIGLIACLNRAEEVATPSLPIVFTTTCAPRHRHAGNARNKSTVVGWFCANANLPGLARHSLVADVGLRCWPLT